MQVVKNIFIILISLFAAFSWADEWKLVWSDEFDKDGLPDKTKWRYEEGFVRNEEMQYYTAERKENARIENGMLIIEGRKEKIKNPKFKKDSQNWKENREDADYTAASLRTDGLSSWKYGRIEMRAKLPEGLGVWPAFWTIGDESKKVGWPKGGEIDIMEFVGFEPNNVHGTCHFSIDNKHKSKGGKYSAEVSPSKDFHIYAIEWFSDRIDFFYDNKKYFTFETNLAGEGEDNPFRKTHFILLNLALGGSWGGKIDDSIFPQKYIIDYVRVYEKISNK